MDKGTGADPKRLRALERWRTVELESAQTDYARLAQAAAEKESALDRMQSDLADTQAFARIQLMADEPLSADSLRRTAEFTALKAQELAAAQTSLDESRASASAAHADVVRHFERLAVVQRLRERRELEAAKDVARDQQKRLDEQGLSRLSAAAEVDTAKAKEE